MIAFEEVVTPPPETLPIVPAPASVAAESTVTGVFARVPERRRVPELMVVAPV
jgi:hypothetical protein